MRQVLRALRELRRRAAQDDLRTFASLAMVMTSDASARAEYVDFLEYLSNHGRVPKATSGSVTTSIINPGDAIRGLRATLSLYGQR